MKYEMGIDHGILTVTESEWYKRILFDCNAAGWDALGMFEHDE